jgi:MoxR-like ATPase
MSAYIARRYIDKNDIDILRDAIKKHQNVLLLGPRGTGKSSLAAAAAAAADLPFCYIPCHTGATTENLIGQWIPNPHAGEGSPALAKAKADAITAEQAAIEAEGAAEEAKAHYEIDAVPENKRFAIEYRIKAIQARTNANRLRSMVDRVAAEAEGQPNYVWMDGILTDAVRNGKVCLLDEINSLKPEVAFAIHGLLDHRRELVLTDKPSATGSSEVITAHKDFAVIAAGNPFYEGVRVMNEAFRDRFAVQLSLGYNAELDHAVIDLNCDGISDEMVVAIRQFVVKIRQAVKNKAIHSDISTRAFLDFIGNLKAHTFQSARTMFLTRYSDDEAEVGAIRTCFNDVWKPDGTPLAVSAADAAEVAAGRAGRFKAKRTGSSTDDQTTNGGF